MYFIFSAIHNTDSIHTEFYLFFTVLLFIFAEMYCDLWTARSERLRCVCAYFFLLWLFLFSIFYHSLLLFTLNRLFVYFFLIFFYFAHIHIHKISSHLYYISVSYFFFSPDERWFFQHTRTHINYIFRNWIFFFRARIPQTKCCCCFARIYNLLRIFNFPLNLPGNKKRLAAPRYKR